MKNKTMKNAIKNIIFMIISGILVLYILMQLILPNMTIKVFGFKPYNVITESMVPVLNLNDVAVVRNPKFDQLKEGDIITFLADINYDGEREIVTHYIHSITINDNNQRRYKTIRYDGPVPDPWTLTDEDILGVYWFKIPVVGFAIQFLKSPFGIATVAVNIIIISVIVYLVKTDKKEKLIQPVN